MGILLALAVAVLGIPSAAVAAPPSNDQFPAATVIGDVPFQERVDNTDATLDGGEPTCNRDYASVWYRFTAPSKGTLVASTFDSTFDGTLAVFTGTWGNLSGEGCSYSSNMDYRDLRVTVAATAGTTYHIRIGAYGSSSSTGQTTLQVELRGTNDAFEKATVIPWSPFQQHAVDTSGATLQGGEPRPCGYMGSTIWYSFDAPSDGRLIAETQITSSSYGFDTVLAFYTGTDLGNLTPLGCNNDFEGSRFSRLGAIATAQTTYYIQLGGFRGDTGQIDFNVEFISFDGHPQPSNDDIAQAIPISSPYWGAAVDTLAASLEGGEPQPSCGETDATAWYLFAPTTSGRAQVDTFGTSLDTILAVYSGTPGQLHPVGCRDNAEGTTQSKVLFDFAAGTNYYIQAGGKVYRYGTIVVNLQEVSVPPNDNFADAAAITPRPFRFDGDTAGATMENEEGEPHLAAGCNLLVLDQTAGYENLDNSVWFRYTTPSRGVATASGTATRFTPRIAVYAGDNMESLTSPMGLRCSDSSKEFIVGPDQTYYIQLAGVDAAAGPYRFTFNVTP